MGRLLLGAALLALGGCAIVEPSEPVLRGETMGSEWTVRIAGASTAKLPAGALREGIQSHFDAVDQALSTWRPDSALSRFNENDSGAWMDIDPELATVMGYGLGLAEDSEGTYDL
ncbi:MAG TPA: FAD:protein FMN transferase, partial [Steroidobacteraceae bacterium]